MNSTDTNSTVTNNNPLDPKLITMVNEKIKNLPKWEFLKEPLVELVAPQQKDFIQQLILDRTLFLLDNKKKLHTLLHRRKKLQESVLPPLSIRFKAKLTSSEPEVVASPAFAGYRKDFDEALANCKQQMKDLFLKTKDLEVELATNKLKSSFILHFHRVVDVKATHELAIMPEADDIEIINSYGGHAILTAMAWRQIIASSAPPAVEPPTDGTTAPPLDIDALPNAQCIHYVNNISTYLNIEPQEFRRLTLQQFDGYHSIHLQNNFTTTKRSEALDTIVTKIYNFILNLTKPMTTTIFNIFLQKKREKESEQKLRAQLKAEKIRNETSLVNDYIDNEDPISAPKMKDFIQEEAQAAFKKVLNDHGKNNNNNNNNKNKNNKRKYENTTTANNNNNHQPTTRSSPTPPTSILNNQNHNQNHNSNQQPHNPAGVRWQHPTHVRQQQYNQYNQSYHQSINNNNHNSYNPQFNPRHNNNTHHNYNDNQKNYRRKSYPTVKNPYKHQPKNKPKNNPRNYDNHVDAPRGRRGDYNY